MKTVFVDTNYFLRFLLTDINAQHLKAKKLFKKGLTGEVELITSEIVFFEIYWVLSFFYGKKKEALVVILEDLLKMSFIKWEARKRLTKSVEVFKELGIDLEDSYNLIFSKEKKIGEMASFDKKLMKVFSG